MRAELPHHIRQPIPLALIVCCLIAFVVMCGYCSRRNSRHYDEPIHLRTGFAHLTRGASLKQQGMKVDPLQGVTPAGNAAWLWLRNGRPEYPITALFSIEQLRIAREANQLIGLLVGLTLALIAWRIWGGWGSALTALAFVFSPMHIAHSSIISTDAQLGAVFLLATIILWRLMHRPGIPVALVMGLMLALTVATKLLALSLLPIMILGLAGRRWLIGREHRECGVSARKWAAIVASIFLAFIFTAWCLHAWSRLGDPESAWGISFSRWKATFDSAMNLRNENRSCYFNGALGSVKVSFLPAALLLKTPLPSLLALLAAIGLRVAERWPGGRLSWPEHSRPFLFSAVCALLFFFGVWASKSPLGLRHVYPTLLFLPLAVGSLAGLRVWGKRWFKVLTGIGCLWLVWGTLRVMPFPIAFFNELAGGPNNAHRWFVDSQLDWGQGLFELKRWQDEHPEARPLKLAYFGTENPDNVGLDYEGLPSPLSPVVTDPKWYEYSRLPKTTSGWIAISETTLKGVYNGFAQLPWDYYQDLEYEPVVEKIAYSIRIIQLNPQDHAPQAATASEQEERK